MEGSSQTITDFLLLPNLTYPFHLMPESLAKKKNVKLCQRKGCLLTGIRHAGQ